MYSSIRTSVSYRDIQHVLFARLIVPYHDKVDKRKHCPAAEQNNLIIYDCVGSHVVCKYVERELREI